MPIVAISGFTGGSLGASQLYDIEYRNYGITDSFTTQRGAHSIKVGGLATFEQKNENGANQTQGNFSFLATTNGRTAFQNFLTGNADGACTTCTYTEPHTHAAAHLRFHPSDFYSQTPC